MFVPIGYNTRARSGATGSIFLIRRFIGILNSMDNQQLVDKLNALEAKIDAIWTSVEKTRKYFLIVIWATIILFVLPLIGLAFVIPSFLDSYLGSINSLMQP